MIHTTILLALLAQVNATETPQGVAQLSWEQGETATFVRGTVPFSGRESPRGWALIDSEGVSHPAQLEEVVRGPNGEVQVFEVISKVPRSDKGLRTGLLSRSTAQPSLPDLEPAHEALPAPLALTAKDANGHSYEAVISSAAPSHQAVASLKRGPIHREDRHALVMLPSTSSREDGAQPHLLGIHAYLGRWRDAGFLTLDLRVHNALIGPKSTEVPIGPAYFESLKLSLPDGWTAIAAFDDPYLRLELGENGESALFIVDQIAETDKDGRHRLHMMPPGASFHRRLAIIPAGNKEAAKAARSHLSGKGWAVCTPKTGLYSWSNPATAHYFPQRELLPNLSAISAPIGKRDSTLLARLSVTGDEHAEQIASGDSGQGESRSGVLGWAHPWFRPTGGGHGGEGITFLEGLRAVANGSTSELRRLRLLHRANTSRQPTGAWRANGDVTHLEEWLNEDGALPFAYHMKANAHHKALRLPCEGGPELVDSIARNLTAERRPSYDQSSAIKKSGARPNDATDILAWHPHDGAHIIRYTSHPKALAWLSNDSLAIDSLLHEAERFRFALTNTKSEDPPLVTIFQLSAFAAEHPGFGLPVGRELGWALDTISAAYSLSDDEARARLLPWILEACALVVQGTPPTGITTRNDHAPLSVPRTHAIAHSFQTAILQLGLRSASRSCLGAKDAELKQALDELLLSCVDSLYFGPVYYPGSKPRTTWPISGDPSGPRWIFPVAPLDWDLAPLSFQEELPKSGFDGGAESAYSNSLLSWAHSLSSNGSGESSRYSARVLDLGPRYKTWADWTEHLTRRSKRRTGVDMLSQAAPALLLAERP